jgi:hypothetical protein
VQIGRDLTHIAIEIEIDSAVEQHQAGAMSSPPKGKDLHKLLLDAVAGLREHSGTVY